MPIQTCLKARHLCKAYKQNAEAYLSVPPETDELPVDFLAKAFVNGFIVEPTCTELVQNIFCLEKRKILFVEIRMKITRQDNKKGATC